MEEYTDLIQSLHHQYDVKILCSAEFWTQIVKYTFINSNQSALIGMKTCTHVGHLWIRHPWNTLYRSSHF